MAGCAALRSTSARSALRVGLPVAARRSATSLATAEDFAYCVDRLERFDREQVQCAMFLPQELRPVHAAIRAFNLETAMVRSQVSDATLGAMRIQWWRDALDGIFAGEPSGTPLHRALAQVVSDFKLSRFLFERILEARQRDLDGLQPSTAIELETYCEYTQSVLLYMLLEAAGCRNPDADAAASHIGKALGIVTLLRGSPYHARERCIYLPVDVLAKAGATTESFYSMKMTSELEEAVFDLASRAKIHLEYARDLRDKVPRTAVPCLQSAVIADLYLERLRKHHFDIFSPSLALNQARIRLLTKLQWSHLRKVY